MKRKDFLKGLLGLAVAPVAIAKAVKSDNTVQPTSDPPFFKLLRDSVAAEPKPEMKFWWTKSLYDYLPLSELKAKGELIHIHSDGITKTWRYGGHIYKSYKGQPNDTAMRIGEAFEEGSSCLPVDKYYTRDEVDSIHAGEQWTKDALEYFSAAEPQVCKMIGLNDYIFSGTGTHE